MAHKIKVGIVGGTGYTGAELIRLLSHHPNVKIDVLTSRSEGGKKVSDIFANFYPTSELVFSEPNDDKLASCDVVFFATPHGVAMNSAKKLLDNNTKIIDLAADFRLQNLDDFSKWYGLLHTCPEVLSQAVYGLPEINRDKIKSANVIGNPGCYPTTAILGLNPVIKMQNQQNTQLIGKHIVIDAKSGVSGAGRNAKMGLLFSELSDNFSAYGVAGHRHQPEIEQGIFDILSAKFPQYIRFVPHLVPMIRGMFSTIHLTLSKEGAAIDWQSVFASVYQDEPFIDVLPNGWLPDTRSVRASNRLKIAICQNNAQETLTVLVVQDNLVKGAAGQAIQNMNLLFGLSETLGLQNIAVMP